MILTGDREARIFCDAKRCPISLQAIGADSAEAVDHVTETALAYGWEITDDGHHFCDFHPDEESR
jgi:hypothetical protein